MRTFPGRRMPKKSRKLIGAVALAPADSDGSDRPFLGVNQDPIPATQEYFSVAVAGITRICFEKDPNKKVGDALHGIGVFVSNPEWDAVANRYVADVHLSHGQAAGLTGAGGGGTIIDFSKLQTAATMGDDDAPVAVVAAAAAAPADASAAPPEPIGGAPAPTATTGAPMDMDAKASAARRQVRAEMKDAEFLAMAEETPAKPTTQRRKRKPKA